MKYRIKPGHTLVDSDGSYKSGGELIDLSDDFVQAHPEKVEPAEPLAPEDGHGD